jgi:hypothetical protein
MKHPTGASLRITGANPQPRDHLQPCTEVFRQEATPTPISRKFAPLVISAIPYRGERPLPQSFCAKPILCIEPGQIASFPSDAARPANYRN